MKRTYENALKLLATRKRKGRPLESAAAAPAHNGNQAPRGVPSLAGMREWLQLLGHSDDSIGDLNIIHVSGTKGKGSTCAFVRSFLRAHGLRTGFPKAIGLYTSPDLQTIRERIQINDQPIMEDFFTRYFFEVWEQLSPGPEIGTESVRQPRYLQLLALVAFHAFIRENVEAAIFETHNGGEFDATNVIQKPVVTGITSLGMDHVAQLGPTIENIAWHKAGIFKPGAPAFSTPQEPGAAKIMRGRAAEKGIELKFVSVDSSLLPANARALDVPVQKLNCSLALALTRTFLQLKAPGHVMSAEDISQGIVNFSWPGRFETIVDGNSEWYLDGAHNELSLRQTAEWFAKNSNIVNRRKLRILIFSHFSEERDGVSLLKTLVYTLLEFDARPDYVIFTTYHEREDGTVRIDKFFNVPTTPFPDYLTMYSSLWKMIDPKARVSQEPTIEGALKSAKRRGDQEGGMQVLVTGSLHLVGSALSLLRL